jgi:hypothetical protein
MPQRFTIGSEEHKERFCRFFTETHARYDPATIAWPDLDESTLTRLRALPFWDEAVSTEHDVARKVQALAPLEPDPMLRDAIALQGYEEARHAALVRTMTSHYELSAAPPKEPPLPANIEWAFIRTGYGECFDSFFAFGLIAMAKESGFFPAALIELFEPIVQEEARHILFFVNWIAYRRARQIVPERAVDWSRCAMAMALQVWARVQTARGASTDDFMLKSHESIEVNITPRRFLELCLRENDRRLSPYDPSLLRPRFVPTVAKTVCKLLRH